MADDTVEAYRLLMADVYELAGLSRRTSEELAAARGQTVARWHVLSVLSGGPHTVAATARRLGLARQSVQRVMDLLHAEQCVAAAADPADRRAPLFALTPRGERVSRELFDLAEAQRQEQLTSAGLSSGELLRARRVVRRLIDAIDPSG